jgi:hypothetical protein
LDIFKIDDKNSPIFKIFYFSNHNSSQIILIMKNIYDELLVMVI